MKTVCIVVTGANANKPKGVMESDERVWIIYASDQAREAVGY